MPLLKEISANAAVAWSPARRRPDLLALGARGDGGVAFENAGGEFSLVSMDLADASPRMLPLGAVKTPSRFMSLAWRDIAKHQDVCPYGVVAGGMADGAVTLWNPKALLDASGAASDGGASCEIGRITRHKGAVNALQFNPHEDSAHLLASGGADGEVYVMSLDKLNAPAVFSPSAGAAAPNAAQQQQPANEISSVAWNTQVNFILATGSQNGSVVVWDLKQKKQWCELRDPNRGSISAIAWHPTAGLQIATASGDDQRPVVKFWDLRTSTTTPVVEFHDHTAGILSMSWCPNDPGLLLSCAKDNRTLVWDLYSQKTVFEFPSDRVTAPSLGSDQFFGSSAGQRRWNVQWSPRIPAVASTCTLDGKVQVWGLSGGGNVDVRPPKWMRRPAGASFGFGGKLVTISNPQEPAGPTADRRCVVHLNRLPAETAVVADAEELDCALASGNYPAHCDHKIATATTEHERSVWSFMKVLFEKDARQHLLLHLGLDAEQISQLNAKFAPAVEEPAPVPAAPTPAQAPMGFLGEPGAESGLGAEDVFSSEFQPPEENAAALAAPPSPLEGVAAIGAALPTTDDDTSERLVISPTPLYTKQSESTLLQALLVGNFEVAVNCCLHYNQFADALLLASCGGPELWEKTQRAFFAVQTRPVMKIVSAIIKNELYDLVAQSDLSEWRQTLAILSTYAKSEEFPLLCDNLASRLEAAGDLHSATLCFMCAVNVEKTVAAWVKECDVETKVHGSTYALQRLVEKVSVFSQAVDQSNQVMGEDVASRFAEYASLMAAQGRLDIAAKYACYGDASNAILRDRIFNAAPTPGYQPPPFPFEMLNVVPQAPGHVAQHHQPQPQQQQQAYWNQQAAPAAAAATQGYGMAQQTAAPTPAYNRAPQTPAYQASYGAPAQQQPSAYPSAQPSYPSQPQAFKPPQAPAAFPSQPQAPAQYQNAAAAQPAYGGHAPQHPAFPAQPGAMYSGPSSTGSAVAAQAQALAGAAAGGGYSAFNAPAAVPPAAIPQGTGVNPLTAQTALNSSRIATPPVDMKSQQKDGFVSSVGNKELAMKYGNETSAALSPMGAAATPASASAVPSAPLGATNNVSAQDMAIVNAFNELVTQVQSLPLTMMEQKQVGEILKSKDLLFTKLNVAELSPALVAKMHEMAACFGQRDFASAQAIYVELTRTEWTTHKDWLRGLKSLIHISMKRFR